MKNHSAPPLSVGISSWSFPWAIGVVKGPRPERPMTARGLLEKAESLSVERVQIADNFPLEGLSDTEIQGLKSFADAAGIQIEVGTRGVEPEHLRRFLDIAQALGSPLVRTIPAFFGERVPLEQVQASLCEVLPAYHQAGLTLALENQEAYTAAEYAGLMKQIDDPHLRMCLDLSNALGAMEGPGMVMERLGPYCGNFHFKDIKIIRAPTLMGFSIEGRPAGQGCLPIRWALGELSRLSLYPSLIIELWPPLQESVEATVALEEDWVRQSVTYCKTLAWE